MAENRRLLRNVEWHALGRKRAAATAVLPLVAAKLAQIQPRQVPTPRPAVADAMVADIWNGAAMSKFYQQQFAAGIPDDGRFSLKEFATDMAKKTGRVLIDQMAGRAGEFHVTISVSVNGDATTWHDKVLIT